MKIYSYSFHPYDSRSTTYTANGSIYPVKFDGVVYDKDNPYYVKTTATTKSSYITYPLTVMRTSSSTAYTVGQIVSGQANCYGFPRLIYVPDGVTVSRAALLETTTISGKYRPKFPNYSAPSTYLSDGCVDVKVSINGETYCALCFPYYSSSWYCQNRIPFTADSPTPTRLTAYKEPSNILETPIGYTVLTSGKNTLNSEYMGVWDFGDAPQIVPEVFKTWIESFMTPIYPYSYTIKSYDGDSVLASLTESPSMVNALLTIVGNQKTLTLTGVNGLTYTAQWITDTPEGKQFLGLATSPNSNRPTLVVNQSMQVSWTGDLVFYESYGVYRPPATTFDINLYQNSAEVNRVDKGQFLVGVGTLSGALREECSILTPSIVYQSSDVPTFNYVYIPIFNRYYYVTSLSSVSKNVWRMELNCDVLMTYKEQIFLLQGVIGRQENDYNPLLVDNELPTQNNPIVEVIDIPSEAFNTQTSDAEHNFLLTVIGA